MKGKKAYIYWTHPLHKSKKLPIGTRYSPHIVRMDDCMQEHWSVCFTITEANQVHEGVIDLSMLIDNEETRMFFEALTPNTKFVLTEGNIEVAHGHML